MNVGQLIDHVLRKIAEAFYRDRPQDFMRDKRALTKAIARYGVECHARGWDFHPETISTDICTLLIQIKQQKGDIAYLPVYLEGAVDRSIRLRADELSEKHKRIANIINSTAGGLKPAAIREPTAVEILAALHADMTKQARQRKAAKKALKTAGQKPVKPAAIQPGLF